MKRKLIDLMNQRSQLLTDAQAAIEAGDQDAYSAAMESVGSMTSEVERLQNLIAEQDRFAAPADDPAAPDAHAENRAETLLAHGTVAYDAADIARGTGIRLGAQNMTTLATGTIVEPTGAGSNIRGGDSAYSALIDQVYAQNLTGLGALLEPYVITEMAAQGGVITATAGQLRTPSDPGFAVAKIAPYEVTVTSYVDRNISRLSPANYEAKIRTLAMRALRRKINALITLGDGQATPDMFGIVNAKNVAGADIVSSIAAAAITVDTVMELMFAYGGDEEIGGAARLYLTKADLQAIGQLRGTNEKKRIYDIVQDAGNANTGVIKDGGLVLPYSINSSLVSLASATAGQPSMIYGDPLNYELGLFGDFLVRVDESYKAGERLLTILGDVFVGGNVIVDKGFVVLTKQA